MESPLRIFSVGTFFYYQKDSLFFLFQLLENKKDDVLVQSFWSTALKPSIDTLDQLDIKSTCEEFDSEYEDEFFEEIGMQPLTTFQEKEMAQFRRIRASKEARQTEFILLKEQANQAFQDQNFTESIRLYSLAAPYSKYDLEVYEKRGISYLKMNQFIHAIADFEYFLSHQPNDETILKLLDEAKNRIK
jgi:tetratricopeptide (TPR) repeat protein